MLRRVIILSDGIRGHFHQSLGIARWLERLGEIEIEPIVFVPKVRGLRRLFTMKLAARRLIRRDAVYCSQWLESMPPLSEVMPSHIPPKVSDDDYSEDTGHDALFISAGSSAAPFCLALARATGNKSAVIMTPSALGTKPFDFAIVPEHDKHSPKEENIITTLGAPNHIYIPELREAAAKLFPEITAGKTKVLALLIGGSDANYRLTPEWVRKLSSPLRKFNGRILLTTSRRTGKEVDDAIEKVFAHRADYMLLASREPDVNPIPAMLGAASHVLVTEDSVSMVSESVTAGFKVGLMRVPRVTGKIKGMLGFGAKRFDELFDRMKSEGLIEEFAEDPGFLNAPEKRHGKDFNEAKRAAEWIIANQ